MPSPSAPPSSSAPPAGDAPATSTAAERSAEQGRLAGRAGVVAAGTLASRLLGLVRDQVIAAMFSRAVTDAFFVAFTLPNVLRQLLAEGAVQGAVQPVLSATREREGEEAARRFFAALRGLSLAALIAACALGVAFAPELVGLFAAGFRADPEQFERTVSLTRWVFPYLFFMGTAALGMAALNSYGRFTVSSFAPALLNVSFIALSLALPALLGAHGYDPALALAAAVLVGGALQVVAQWPSLRRIGYLDRPRLDFGNPGVREVLRRMAPLLFGMGVYYIDVLLARRLLSELGEGAQSYFSWALRLCDFPQGIFVMALQTAALPSLSRLATREDRGELAETFAFGMRLSLFVGIPATALSVALAEPLVALLFERGHFDAVSTRETARALVAQGSGIWLVAAVRQLLSLYYALGDTRTPAIVAALDLIAFLALALLLRGPLGHVGVSWAVTGASAVQALLLAVGLARKVHGLGLGAIAVSGARTAASAGASVAAALLAARGMTEVGFGLPGQGVAGALAGAAAFFVAARLFGSPELATLTAAARRRFGRGRGNSRDR